MKSKKKLVIVTANDFLAYQPSVLNLYDFLETFFDVSIVAFDPQYIAPDIAEPASQVFRLGLKSSARPRPGIVQDAIPPFGRRITGRTRIWRCGWLERIAASHLFDLAWLRLATGCCQNWRVGEERRNRAKNVVQPVVQTLLRFAAYAGNI